LVPFALHWIFEVLFKVYILCLEDFDVVDWKDEDSELIPTKEFKQHTYAGNLCFYCAILAVFLAGKHKIPRLLELICTLFIVIICVTSYLIQPYNPEYPREFLNWALILLFRCAVVCLLFQINGTYDVLISTLSPMIIIIAGGFNIGR
jgi:hypothetical protein